MNSFRPSAVVIMVLWLTVTPVLTNHAAELRDYRLPSEKGRPGYEVQTMSPDDEFRAKVKPLTPRQRRQLKESFLQKCTATNRADEKAYYSNLIRILDEYGTK